MYSLNDATKIIKKKLPKFNIQKAILYKNKYIFMAFSSDELDKDYDPFYSIDIKTGKFSDFSIITDGDITEITDKFKHENLLKRGGE